MKRFIPTLLFLFCINILSATDLDFFRNSISIHFYKAGLRSSDNFRQSQPYFTENYLHTFSAYYNRTFYAYRKVTFSYILGFNHNTYQVGYVKRTHSLPSTTGNFSFKNTTYSCNIGVLTEVPVISIRKTEVLIGAGIFISKRFASESKYFTSTFPSNYSNEPDKYLVHFPNINETYSLAILQLKIEQTLKSYAPHIGIRCINGGNFLAHPLATYDIFYTINSNGEFVYTAGKFGTSGPKIEFFAGLSF